MNKSLREKPRLDDSLIARKTIVAWLSDDGILRESLDVVIVNKRDDNWLSCILKKR